MVHAIPHTLGLVEAAAARALLEALAVAAPVPAGGQPGGQAEPPQQVESAAMAKLAEIQPQTMRVPAVVAVELTVLWMQVRFCLEAL